MKFNLSYAAGYLCLVMLFDSCVVKKEIESAPVVLVEEKKEEVVPENAPPPVEEVEKPSLLKAQLIKLAVENAHDIYKKEAIAVNVPLFIYQLDAKFTNTQGTFTLRMDNYEAKKVNADSIFLKDFPADSLWYAIDLDSAAVEVTCIYEVVGLEKHPLPGCIKNSYLIREDALTNNLNYKPCY